MSNGAREILAVNMIRIAKALQVPLGRLVQEME
jgi:hypothetical protein